jgi:ribosome recycling factor
MISSVLWNIEEKMEKAIGGLKMELATIRTGHAGVPTPLNQIAGISAPEVRLLVIQPWDRSCIRDIEKAILKSELGLNPTSDGNLVRISIPPLTEERRQELVRVVRKRIEERRITIRNLRREAMEELKQLEKNKEISQDENKRALDQLQKLTDSFIFKTEQIGRDKEAELAEV